MRALFATILLGLAIPMNASAAICVGYSDYDSTKCKIPLCALRPGGFSTSKCRSPLALMAWRAFWGQPPIPLPPSECGCNWIPPLVVPTDQYGVPLSVTKDGALPFTKSGLNNFTPFNKASATTQYAQANTHDVMVFDQKNGGSEEIIEQQPVTSLLDMSPSERNTLAANIMANQDDFFTTCNDNSFTRSGRSSSCYTTTKNSRTDILMTHSTYRAGGKRRDRYDYKIMTRSLDHSNPSTEIRMRINHDAMTYCQRFVAGAAVTDTNCGIENLSNVVRATPDVSDPTVPSFPLDEDNGPNPLR